jgi:hypothetical protein
MPASFVIRILDRRPALAGAAIAVGSALLVCLPSAPGVFGALGLLLRALTVLGASIALWTAVPALIVALVPALIPTPIFLYTFAWELALLALAFLALLHGLRLRAPWPWRLGAIEGAWLVYVAWAVFTGLWSADRLHYALGVRRLVVGYCVLWVALRLPHLASRRWFETGIAACAIVLALAMIRQSGSTGYSLEQTLIHRGTAMNLGWGKDNYIAGLLLICAPLLLRGALQGPRRERVLPAIAFALVTLVQVIIASRAGTLLFVAGTLVQLIYATRRHRVVVGLVAVGVLAALVASPMGLVLLTRMTSLREFASFTIRIWYWREGWRRLVEHLPWGMGLGQGIENPDHLHGTDPHDFWLLLGGDLGIPGMLLWSGVLVAIVRAWLAVGADPRRRELAFTVLLSFALGNTHALVEPTFSGGQYQLLFLWIVCGSLAYAQAERARDAGAPLAGAVPASTTGWSVTPAASGA